MYTYIPSRLIRLITHLQRLERRISFFFLLLLPRRSAIFTLDTTVKISFAKIYPSCAFLRAWETTAKVRKNSKAEIRGTEKRINDTGVRDTPYTIIAGCEAYSTCNSYHWCTSIYRIRQWRVNVRASLDR